MLYDLYIGFISFESLAILEDPHVTTNAHNATFRSLKAQKPPRHKSLSKTKGAQLSSHEARYKVGPLPVGSRGITSVMGVITPVAML